MGAGAADLDRSIDVLVNRLHPSKDLIICRRESFLSEALETLKDRTLFAELKCKELIHWYYRALLRITKGIAPPGLLSQILFAFRPEQRNFRRAD